MKKKEKIITIVILILLLAFSSMIVLAYYNHNYFKFNPVPKITEEECSDMGGRTVFTAEEECAKKDVLGGIVGILCPCVCCKN